MSLRGGTSDDHHRAVPRWHAPSEVGRTFHEVDGRFGKSVAVVAACCCLTLAACESEATTASDRLEGAWTVESDETRSVLDLPTGTTLTVEITVDVAPGVDDVVVTLGCGRHGGGAESMDPLSVPEPTVQSPACEPEVQAAEQQAAEFVLGAEALRVDDGRLLVVRDGAALSLERG